MSRLGLQIAPWSTARELVATGEQLADVVDTVWVQDQMLARNVYALLAALAHAGCGVGTNVTYAIGRNPIEMAAAAATVAELVPEEREMVVGIGTGGALVSSLFVKDRPVAVTREAIVLMRALWSGEEVELDSFEVLGRALGYKPGALARLTFPVERPPAILVAGVGPKILRVAGAVADGLISPSNLPSLLRAAFDTGLGVAGAAERVSAEIADALVVSGTPDECVERLAELRDLATAHGYEDFYIGAPLGPDPREAAELLRTVVIPELWPERVAGAR
jgi:5,10-methylenetetrahydromethanopterin reductase